MRKDYSLDCNNEMLIALLVFRELQCTVNRTTSTIKDTKAYIL